MSCNRCMKTVRSRRPAIQSQAQARASSGLPPSIRHRVIRWAALPCKSLTTTLSRIPAPLSILRRRLFSAAKDLRLGHDVQKRCGFLLVLLHQSIRQPLKVVFIRCFNTYIIILGSQNWNIIVIFRRQRRSIFTDGYFRLCSDGRRV